MKKILLISSRLIDLKNFINLLNVSYEVKIAKYIEGGQYLLEVPIKYDLIILEITIQPSDNLSLEETIDGQITGIIWYEKFLKDLDIPVLFWDWDFNGDKKNYVEILKLKFPGKKIFFLNRGTDKDHLLLGVNEFFKK